MLTKKIKPKQKIPVSIKVKDLSLDNDRADVKKTISKKEAEFNAKLKTRREQIRRERGMEIDEEERDEEIEESLLKIYSDKEGSKIDVKKLKIRKKHGFVFWFFNFLVIGLICVVLGLGVYYYIFYTSGTDSTAVEIEIESKENISTNEEFFYTIKYKNSSYVALRNVSIEVEYPANFIFLDSTIRPEKDNNLWKLGRVAPRSEGNIQIKGKIIATPETSSIIIVRIIYTPENFSSEFRKEASFNNIIQDIGFEADFEYPSTVLINEESVITINLKSLDQNFINEFVMRMEADDNIKITDTVVNEDVKSNEFNLMLVEEKDEEEKIFWRISGVNEKEEKIEIKYKIEDKITDTQKIKFYFDKDVDSPEGDSKRITFFEQEIDIEVMKSDLNLILIQNGSQEDGTVDFEEKLNYSLAYANKGEATLNNVSIMMILSSDFLDWTTLKDENLGKERGDTIFWTEEEIPDLKEIGVEDEGVIDFSINVMPFTESDLGKNFKIISYAQYNIGSMKKIGEINLGTSTDTSNTFADPDSRSNTIVSKINSDLKLKEEIRYFDDNNMPVGMGPLPPQVGEKSSFKVYWVLNNNLHELKDVIVEASLPNGINWDERNRTSVGAISYDRDKNIISWQIGRLPITVFRADAEFSISITPKENDRNKIIVLSTGASVVATDVNTEDKIERATGPKTTRLEDDDIASISSDGRVK